MKGKKKERKRREGVSSAIKPSKNIAFTYDFMISHHIIKLLINFFIFLFCVGGEDI